MKCVELAVNNTVMVKLTEAGRDCLRRNNERLEALVRENGGALFSHSREGVPLEDANGWSSWLLWELMSKLGPHMYHGGDVLVSAIRVETNNGVKQR